MHKQKVLFLTSRIPYPPVGGDKLKAYNVLKILNRNFDVFLVIITDETKLTREAEKFLTENTSGYKLFKRPKLFCYFNALKFIINRLPIQVNYYHHSKAENYIRSIAEKFDISIASSSRTALYLLQTKGKKIWDAVDSISINYQRSVDKVTSFFWKLIYKIEAKRLQRFERTIVSSYDASFFVNKDESEFWNKHGASHFIPNGVNEALFTYNQVDNSYRNDVVFFGKMDYQPNIDAVKWFIQHVLPLLPDSIRFVILGYNPHKQIVRLSMKHKNVIVTGFVEDPYLIINSCLCSVAPMQTGGGIQNKVLESLALGTPTIVSSLAGIAITGAQHGKHFFISDNPQEIATLITKFKDNRDSEELKSIKKNSKELMLKQYSWDNYQEKLVQLIQTNVHGIDSVDQKMKTIESPITSKTW